MSLISKWSQGDLLEQRHDRSLWAMTGPPVRFYWARAVLPEARR